MPSKKIILLFLLALLVLVLFVLSVREIPKDLVYGASFSRFHTDELKLPWKDVYLAMLDDLKIRHFRFSAHWPLTEPEDGKFNFEELDFQMEEAKRRGADVVLAVGRRLPGWPECHVPGWAKDLNVEERQEKILRYIEMVVNRYKNYENIKYWQVENEPFLALFARSNCGKLDVAFLKKEIELVRKLDPLHPVLTTDSGEMGTWVGPHRVGDAFGSTMYIYISSKKLGSFKYPLPPAFFRIKQNLVEMVSDKKPMLLIELAVEPWLTKPIVDTSMEEALSRMGIDKVHEVITFAKKTGFREQYLWGVEWWYYMKQNGHPEFWEKGLELFGETE